MMILGAVALLVLTAAVVLLFAMVGELASRVPAADGDDGYANDYSDFIPGAAVSRWPGTLAGLAGRRSVTVLVLSSICTTCNEVAGELASYRAEKLAGIGVVVSCALLPAGEEFVQQHAIDHLPHYIDDGGAWVRDSFGVNKSPVALRFEDGVLVEAYQFNRLKPLLGRISNVLEGVS